MITTALPQMAISLHADPVRLSVAVTAYLLSLAIFVPVSGWAADRFGGRTIFRAAIALFTLGSILCGLSGNVIELTAARVLQGLGGAMMVPVGRLVLFRSVEKAPLIATMAYLQVPAQLGPVLGPPIGGFITTYFSWRWIFLVNVPLGILGIVLVTLFFDNPKEETRRPLDWIGFVLTGAALFCIMYGVEAIGRGRSEFGADDRLAGRRLRAGHARAAASVARQSIRCSTFRCFASPPFERASAAARCSAPAPEPWFSAAAAAADRVRPVGIRLGEHHLCHRRRLDVDEGDGAADHQTLRLPQRDPLQWPHQRRHHRHVRVLHRVDARVPDLRAAARRRLFPVAAVHRDAGDDLCRRGSAADEHGDQHRQHDAATEPRLRHLVRGGAAASVARLAWWSALGTADFMVAFAGAAALALLSLVFGWTLRHDAAAEVCGHRPKSVAA